MYVQMKEKTSLTFCLQEMDYKKTKKPFHNRKKQKMRRKENKLQTAKEKEFQLPSSNRGNVKDFFSDI